MMYILKLKIKTYIYPATSSLENERKKVSLLSVKSPWFLNFRVSTQEIASLTWCPMRVTQITTNKNTLRDNFYPRAVWALNEGRNDLCTFYFDIFCCIFDIFLLFLWHILFLYYFGRYISFYFYNDNIAIIFYSNERMLFVTCSYFNRSITMII